MADQFVFVTGGSGHLGYRILVEALRSNYRVRAAVRSQAKADAIKAGPSIKPYLDKLEFAIVPDIVSEGAYDNVLTDITHVIHTASPIGFPSDDYDGNLISPAIKGTTGILMSAAKQPSIKRIVITSSAIAVIPWKEFLLEETDVVYKDDNTMPQPRGPYENEVAAYAASKTFALQATNEFISTHRPAFDVVNIMPSYVIGKNELITTPDEITKGTNGAAFAIVFGEKSSTPRPGPTVHLDDVAVIHVKALDPKIAGNQNFMVSGGGLKGSTWSDALEIVKRHFPTEVEEGIFPLGGEQPTKVVMLDSSRTEEVFGIRFKTYEEQVLSVARHYLELRAGASK